MKIGIITMHRVRNLGSALQTYALQHKIEQLGYSPEIIDYVFPPIPDGKCDAVRIKSRFVNVIKRLVGVSEDKRNSRIDSFLAEYVKCSAERYDKESIHRIPPSYDIYCTGSDQVWNHRHIKDDTTFFLDFAPDDKPKISYAASFSGEDIPVSCSEQYSKYLKRYESITVRECSGARIVKDLVGKEAGVVCDPTILLDKNDWNHIAEKSSISIKGGYILVYLLRYMFDPRPFCYKIVSYVQKQTNLPVYCINGGFSEITHMCAHQLSGVGPEEFVSLIQHASFIITDSFHGTAMATIFNIPVLALVKSKKEGDGRISTLRMHVGNQQSVCGYDTFDYQQIFNMSDYLCNEDLLEEYRNQSADILKDMLSCAATKVKEDE